ncbi:homoserine kinase type II [Sinorhizobium fredii]
MIRFLADYDVGTLTSYKGIAEGVENSNFLLHTTTGSYILTLYEKRVNADDLPFFLGLMHHLAERGLSCPLPLPRADGALLGTLSGRPAAVISFLEGMWLRKPGAQHCREVGRALASMHEAGDGFALKRPNALSVGGWRPLWRNSEARADEVQDGLKDEIAAELAYLEEHWPKRLPEGVIHADLFPDNVFFLGDRLSGLIDFYFACNDFLAYDIAVCLNSWCFEKNGSYNITKGMALLSGYESVRKLTAERGGGPAATGPGLGAAFLPDAPLRLADDAGRRPGGQEGPAGISDEDPLPPRCRLERRIRPQT